MTSSQHLPRICIVIPCYNEEEVLPVTFEQINTLMHGMVQNKTIDHASRICFVDDGSKDDTWSLITTYSNTSSYVSGLRLSTNVGHQNALLAGLLENALHFDCCISIDADLQDDIHVIPLMIERHLEGHDIVYGVRNNRQSDTFFKRCTASLFYKLMTSMKINIVPQHADFRLLSSKALACLAEYPERNLFLRALVPSIGLSFAKVSYARKKRNLGESKYPLTKMLSFAWQGITSFSATPLRFISLTSFFGLAISLFIGCKALIDWLAGNTVSGWTSIMVGIVFIGSIQLLSIAILGEYIAKIYIEVKRRPRYMIRSKI